MASKKSASQKAAAARQAAAELRARQKSAARRDRILRIVGAFVIAAAFGALLLFIMRTGEESGPYAIPNSGELTVPSVVDETNGILVGPGGVVGGAVPEDAVRIDVFEDPLCPWCAYFVQNASPEIGTLVDQGEVAFYYHPVSILDDYSVNTHYSTRMVNAWVTVAEYDPENFWSFVELSYYDPPAELEKGLKNEEIADLAREAGVSEDAIDKIADGEFTMWVEDATNKAATEHYDPETGGFGTPTLLIGGVRFRNWVEPGQITAAVAYVRDYGADALEELLATPVEPSPSPTA